MKSKGTLIFCGAIPIWRQTLDSSNMQPADLLSAGLTWNLDTASGKAEREMQYECFSSFSKWDSDLTPLFTGHQRK